MQDIKLYRRRFIPDEKILLKNDKIIEMNENVIITKWNVLKKRDDFTHGASCYFLKEGFKVSKFIDLNNNILYWYCDIIEWIYSREENVYIFNDLLIDVLVYENGFVKVVDIGEIACAVENNLIDIKTAMQALKKVDKLLDIIYSGKFDILKRYILDI